MGFLKDYEYYIYIYRYVLSYGLPFNRHQVVNVDNIDLSMAGI